MRSYLSGLRINITLIFMSSSSYLVHAISCRIILLKYRFFFFLVSTFYFWRPDNLSPVTHHPPPAIRHPLPLTRYPSPATRHPSPVTRGKVLPFLPKGQVSGGRESYFPYIPLNEIQTMFSQPAKRLAMLLPADLCTDHAITSKT